MMLASRLASLLAVVYLTILPILPAASLEDHEAEMVEALPSTSYDLESYFLAMIEGMGEGEIDGISGSLRLHIANEGDHAYEVAPDRASMLQELMTHVRDLEMSLSVGHESAMRELDAIREAMQVTYRAENRARARHARDRESLDQAAVELALSYSSGDTRARALLEAEVVRLAAELDRYATETERFSSIRLDLAYAFPAAQARSDALGMELERVSYLLRSFTWRIEALLSGTEAGLRLVSSAFGCPQSAPEGTLRGYHAAGETEPGSDLDLQRQLLDLCMRSISQATSRAAAEAIEYGFHMLGAPYACEGRGRSDIFRFDCSSFVSRAYHEAAGLPTARVGWAPSTRDMVPWDGHTMAGWLYEIEPESVMPGDLVLFDTGLLTSRHVVMVLSDGMMMHTSRCGDVLHITASWLEDIPEGVILLGARRVDPDFEAVDGGNLEDMLYLHDEGTSLP